jgi:hypothetical protein
MLCDAHRQDGRHRGALDVIVEPGVRGEVWVEQTPGLDAFVMLTREPSDAVLSPAGALRLGEMHGDRVALVKAFNRARVSASAER